MSREEETLPKRRRKYLVVQELDDEVLVYDWVGHRAVCLNPTSALIWRHCNGRTTVDEMACILQRELDIPADSDVVRFGLEKLRESKLLYQPNGNGGDGLSRRELLGRMAAASIPVVITLAVPSAAGAITGITQAQCVTRTPCDPDCNGFVICQDNPGKFCCPNSKNLAQTQNCNCTADNAAGCVAIRALFPGRPGCCDTIPPTC